MNVQACRSGKKSAACTPANQDQRCSSEASWGSAHVGAAGTHCWQKPLRFARNACHRGSLTMIGER